MAKNLKIKDHQTGTTYEGLGFLVEVNGRPIDLTGAIITMTLTPSTGAPIEMNLPVTDVRGRFQITRQLIELPAGAYRFEIEIVKANGDVKKYITGSWRIL